MKFNVTTLALTSGLVWGAAILIVASANMIWPNYGRLFLDLAGSIYPGYKPGSGVGSVVIVTVYGLVDGAIAGAVFGWLHNLLANLRSGSAA